MRITANMLNEQMKKAGLGIAPNTLLDYINKGNSGNGLLDALQSKSDSMVNTQNRARYEKLEKASDLLSAQAGKLTKKGEDSLFEKAKASGDYTEIYEEVEALVDSYNDTLDALGKETGALNLFYRQSLTDITGENKEALDSIGITVNKNGSLKLDKDKLKAADLETLEKVLGSEKGVSDHLAFVSSRIADNARTNVESMSEVYKMDGSLISAYPNQYNFWG